MDIDEELGERELSCGCCVAVDMTGLQMLKDALEKAQSDAKSYGAAHECQNKVRDTTGLTPEALAEWREDAEHACDEPCSRSAEFGCRDCRIIALLDALRDERIAREEAERQAADAGEVATDEFQSALDAENRLADMTRQRDWWRREHGEQVVSRDAWKAEHADLRARIEKLADLAAEHLNCTGSACTTPWWLNNWLTETAALSTTDPTEESE